MRLTGLTLKVLQYESTSDPLTIQPMNTTVAVLSGSLIIHLTPKQLQNLLKQWQEDGQPGDQLTFQLVKPVQ